MKIILKMKIQVIQKALSDENNIVNLRLETVPKNIVYNKINLNL